MIFGFLVHDGQFDHDESENRGRETLGSTFKILEPKKGQNLKVIVS